MQVEKTDFTVIYFSGSGEQFPREWVSPGGELKVVAPALSQEEYIALLNGIQTKKIILVDGSRVTLDFVRAFLQNNKQSLEADRMGYVASGKLKLGWGNIRNLWKADQEVVSSPIFMGSKTFFLKAYGGKELAGGVLAGIGYSLQKIGGLKFNRIQLKGVRPSECAHSKWNLWFNYTLRLPFREVMTGRFFSCIFSPASKVQRDMVFRMLFLLFACFTFIFMPYVSRDFGVTGDEFVDHRHAGYVLDYFANGDKTALEQPKTALHLYGNSVQVITAAICRWFEVDNYYELRHFVGGMVGALGILAAGWMGLRWGGGLCGLLSLLLMFFTPRFFGHSMNNLKDIPFAVGYMLAIFYTVRLFDYYPFFRLRHMLGLVLGIALALGTRSGGLILYPMVFMYAGLYYILYYGIRNFYKFRMYAGAVGRILQVLFIVFICSYFLSILLWPFALQKPLTGVFYSLAKFTNYNIGLRTIFDGQQMMSNMLPWNYAPKYLGIGMPIVVLAGFGAYLLYMIVRKKEFSLISFFLWFAAIFPVYWVIHCHSNLYGGIRHLLFVMPPMVVIAGRFWSGTIAWCRGYLKLLPVVVFIVLFSLPVTHTLRNHPNEYVYFNEFVGGLKGAYGDYETDYYFNSLKNSADWFKKEILPVLPKDKKTVVVTQAGGIMQYYFRKDTNVKVIYSRYYEKYSKDWDYAIFANVYISPFQLRNHLFPPVGYLYASMVDGCPVSYVFKRDTKQELQGFQLEKEQKYKEAIEVFKEYVRAHPQNEEVWSRMGKLYYMTEQPQEAKKALEHALSLQPALNESLYILALVNAELKDYPAAFKAIERMLAENAASADAWYLKALLYYRMKQYQNAVNALNRLLAYRPDFDRAHVLAGDIFRDNNNFEQAAKMYEKALQSRNSVNTAVQLADMWVRLRKYGQAEELLNRIKQFESAYYPIYKVESRKWLQENQWKTAGEILKRMDDINNDPELFVLRAMYAVAVNNKQEARSMIEQALTLEPENREALDLKKRILE